MNNGPGNVANVVVTDNLPCGDDVPEQLHPVRPGTRLARYVHDRDDAERGRQDFQIRSGSLPASSSAIPASTTNISNKASGRC